MLIVFSCLNNTGCGESSGAYYLTRPDLQERVKYLEWRTKEVVGETVMTYAVPLTMVAAGREGSITLTKNLSLKGRDLWKSTDLIYTYSF